MISVVFELWNRVFDLNATSERVSCMQADALVPGRGLGLAQQSFDP